MKNILKRIDFTILISVILLVFIGLIGLYGATINEEANTDFYKQAIWFGISLIVVVIISFVNYKWIGTLSFLLFPICIVLLFLVLKTTPINGARSWFDLGNGTLFQPAEIAKIIYILILAKYLSYIKSKDESLISKWWNLVIVFILFLMPTSLILIQPDFGTAAAFVFITIFMLFISGLNYKYILVGIVSLILLAYPIYLFGLNGIQKARIDVFFNPELDPLGKGYNVIQSKLAIGSGQILGMGVGNGNQTQLGFIPIKTTDFIFSVISEEMGFLVSLLIIVIYMFLIRRLIRIAMTSSDMYGSLIVIGIAGMFTFHVLENIGMTMGLLPITGVPLPFVSYGGSSLLTNMIAIAIALSISSRRQKSLFLHE